MRIVLSLLTTVCALTAVVAEDVVDNSAELSAELSAEVIMSRSALASGGDAWLNARSNVMTGTAMLYRAGMAINADRYEMRRIYPADLPDAHTNTGKFRLDAYRGDRSLFSISFDGKQMYDLDGPMSPERAAELAASSFGFSAVRFALREGFILQRQADDQVEGYPSHFIQITDPSAGKTLVGIDAENMLIRYVGWQTPRGWHHRVYSDYYALESGFMQPGRVRLYYDGIKTADINWTAAELNTEIADSVFKLAAPAE